MKLVRASFREIAVYRDEVRCMGQRRRNNRKSICGVRFDVAAGAPPRTRMTATRVATGGVVAGPFGAILGGMARKQRGGDGYVVVSGPDFEWRVPVPRGDFDKASRFVAAANTAVACADCGPAHVTA